jgi:tetratricopeptide (TPR) repeat protein
MASHKIILRALSPESDLASVVYAVSSICHAEPKVVTEQLKHLPLTLLSSCSNTQARKIQTIFSDLQTEISILPPLPELSDFSLSLPTDPARKRPGRASRWPAMLAVLIIIAFAVSGLFWGARYIISHVKPDGNHPSNAKVEHMMKASEGEVEDARVTVAKALAQKPKDVPLLIQKAVIYLGISRKKMTFEGWKSYGAVGGDVPREGQDLLPTPEADTAVATLFRAKDMDSTNPEVYRWLCEVYMQKGLVPEALVFAQKAVLLQDTNAVYQNLLGLALLESGNVGKAEMTFRSAIKRSPAYVPTFRNLGVLLLYHQRDSVQGLAWLYQYLSRENGKDLDRYTLRKEMMSTAFASFNPAFEELFPEKMSFQRYEFSRLSLEEKANQDKDPRAMEEMALLYLSQGMDEAALKLFSAVTKTGDGSEVAWKMQVCLYAKAKLWDAMHNTLKNAIAEGVRDPFFEKNRGVVEKYWRLDLDASSEAFSRYMKQGGDLYRDRVQAELDAVQRRG